MDRKIDHSRKTFAKTNIDTVLQRVEIIKTLLPDVKTIGEICCGDCTRQFEIYKENFALSSYRGLDIDPFIVKFNLKKGIECLCGSAVDAGIMKNFINYDIIFYGPPLSENCDGHAILDFKAVEPSFLNFMKLIYQDLKYQGMIVCICPRTADMADTQIGLPSE